MVPQLLTFLYHNRQGVTQPRIQAFLTAQRAAAPTTPVGVAGFCWGGLHAVLLAHDTPKNTTLSADGTPIPLIDCAFTAHPSLLSVPGHIHGVVQPLSVANGDVDEYMSRDKMVELTRLLKRKESDSGDEGRYQVVVYPGAKHGFAVRGDPADERQKERGEGSENQAVEWFQKWLREGVVGA
jgi:dienelactone hydrolase